MIFEETMKKTIVAISLLLAVLITACGMNDSMFQKQYDDVMESLSDAGIDVQNNSDKTNDIVKSDSKTSKDEEDSKTGQLKQNHAFVNDQNEGTIKIEGKEDIIIENIIQGTLMNNAILVYLSTNKELVLSDVNQTKNNTIATGVSWYYILDHESLIYEDNDNSYYKYRFKDAYITNMGNVSRYNYSNNGNRVVYIVDNALYILDSSESEPSKIADLKERSFIGYISADGKQIVWSDYDDQQKDLYSYYEGKTTHLASEQDDSMGIANQFVYNEYSPLIKFYDNIFVLQNGIPVFSKKLASNLRGNRYYTSEGMFETSRENMDFSALYSIKDSNSYDKKGALYYYEQDGQNYVLLDNIIDAVISNQRLYYADEDGNLIAADIAGEHINNREAVDEHLYCIITCLNGFIYYIKNNDRGNEYTTQDLYVYNDHDKSTCIIAEDVCPEFTYFSKDGKTCLFGVQNYNEDYKLHNAHLFDMCLFNYDGGEVVPFAELVYGNLVVLSKGYLDPSNIYYYKYNGTAPTDEELDLSYCYYDGIEHHELNHHKTVRQGTYEQRKKY